jgi:type IV secretory pathway VirB2 component (pilin)
MLTKPTDYPKKTGLDPKDQNHPNIAKKIVKIFLTPVPQKIINQNLWFETISVLMVIFMGFGELFGRRFSIEWNVVLIFSLIIVGIKTATSLNIFKGKSAAPEVDGEVDET